MDAGASFDWCSFFALFWNDKKVKCKLNVPDTVLFRYGQLSAWWATNKNGCIQRHASTHTTLEAIRRTFLQVAQEDDANYTKYVAIARTGDGRPQLLRTQAFNQLIEQLSDRIEAGVTDANSGDTPTVLQAFIQPFLDMRYVTTYINNGTSVVCHTFQRKFSRRYSPLVANTAAGGDKEASDLINASGEYAQAQRAEIEQQEGAVDHVLKMQFRRLTQHLVNYIERAHGLTLGGIVCEYIRDANGKPYLLAILRTEWASNAAGNGGGSFSAANLLEDPMDEPDIEDMAIIQEEMEDNGPGPLSSPTGNSDWGGGFAAESRPASAMSNISRPMSAVKGLPRPRSSAQPVTSGQGDEPGGNKSSLVVFPGGAQHSNNGLHLLSNWPAVAPREPEAPPPRPRIESARSMGGMSAMSSPGIQQQQPPQQQGYAERFQQHLPPRPGSSPVTGDKYLPSNRMPSAALQRSQSNGLGVRSSSPRGLSPDRPNTAQSRVTGMGVHVNAGPRGAPLMMQRMSKELETLRDQLLYTHEVAEGSLGKVRSLEREKDVLVSTFESQVKALSHQLADTQEELRCIRQERDSLQQRVNSAESRVSQLEGEKGRLHETVDTERTTAMTTFREYQQRDAQMKSRVEQLESECRRVSELLREEQTTVTALKRQLIEYQDIVEKYKSMPPENPPEPGMKEVLETVRNLLEMQGNPQGEQYSLQKVLQTYHGELRSVFLYYSQLESSFTDHWPPSMTFNQWMLFCKDSEASDPRAGARIRSNVHNLMVSPQECEQVFRCYARPDLEAVDSQPVLSYEGFLAGVVHLGVKLKRPEVPYLSEACREFILRYLCRANKVSAVGLKKNDMKRALAGVKPKRGGMTGAPTKVGGMSHSGRAPAF